MKQEKKAVVLISNDSKYEQKIALMLKSNERFALRKIASNKSAFFEHLRTSNETPDIVLILIGALHIKSKEITILLRENYPGIKIILACEEFQDAMGTNMHVFMGDAYLLKNTSKTELATCLQAVVSEGFYYNKDYLSFMREVHATFQAVVLKKEVSSILSIRELQVIELICQQKTTAEISEDLFLSHRTIEGHRNNLLLKTGAKNMAGLVVYAFQNELVAFKDLPTLKTYGEVKESQ
ncbi:response regulator transcription factor [Flavicella sp.]|jgi:DNA-binding NarL/FixJ family response regulator|nr:response regulator transcription factor [Flavicella sp.]MDA9111377.1 response regulator transcription factor [Flavicella sp.]